MTTRDILNQETDIASRELNQAIGLLKHAQINHEYYETEVPDIEDSTIHLPFGYYISISEGGWSSGLYFETEGESKEIKASYSLVDLVKYYINNILK